MTLGSNGKYSYIPPSGGGKGPGGPGRTVPWGHKGDGSWFGGSGGEWNGSRIGAYYLGYRAISELGRGFRYTNNQILNQGARDKLNVANQSLASIDMTAHDRAIAEASGNKFLQQYPYTGDMTDYLYTRAQVGSTWDKNQLGAQSGEMITQTGMKLGALTQMKPRKATDLITNRMKAEEQRMTTAQRGENIRPGSEWFRRRPGQVAALISGAVEKYKIWGPDIEQYEKSSLAMEKQLGWSPERSMAFLGLQKSSGFRASTVGQFTKRMASDDPKVVARLQMMNEMDEKGRHKYDFLKLTQAKYKGAVQAHVEENARRNAADPWYLADELIRQNEIAKNEHSNPLELAGAGKHYIGQYHSMVEPAFDDQWKKDTQWLKGRTTQGIGYLNQQLGDNRADMITPYKELGKAMNLAAEAAAKLNGGMPGVTQMIGALNKYSGAYQQESVKKTALEDLEKVFPRGKEIKDLPKFMEQRKKLLLDSSSTLDRQQLHNLEISTRPEIYSRHDRQAGQQVGSGVLGRAWDWVTMGGTPLSDKYKFSPLLETLENGGNMISPREPRKPTQGQWDADFEKATGQKMPIATQGGSSGLAEPVSAFGGHVAAFGAAVAAINKAAAAPAPTAPPAGPPSMKKQ